MNCQIDRGKISRTGLLGCLCRRDGIAHPSPYVDFVGKVRFQIEIILHGFFASRKGGRIHRRARSRRRRLGAERWKKIGAGDAGGRTRLQQSRICGLQILVCIAYLRFDAVEHRILEQIPPGPPELGIGRFRRGFQPGDSWYVAAAGARYRRDFIGAGAKEQAVQADQKAERGGNPGRATSGFSVALGRCGRGRGNTHLLSVRD